MASFSRRAERSFLLFDARSFVVWHLKRKSGGPALFAPSLNVQGDDTHDNSGFSVTRSINDSFPEPRER
jgi:hypothetical protein